MRSFFNRQDRMDHLSVEEQEVLEQDVDAFKVEMQKLEVQDHILEPYRTFDIHYYIGYVSCKP